MGWSKRVKQFFDFDEGNYRREINNYSENQLRAAHRVTQEKITGAIFNAAVSGASIPLSGPIGFVGAAISGRRFDVNEQRLAIIERRLREKGWSGYEMRKRDHFKAAAVVGAAHLVAPGADAVIGHFAGQAAHHVASNLHNATSPAMHHGLTAAGQVAEHPEVFAKGIEDGIVGQLGELTHHTFGHVAQQSVYGDIAANNASALGIVAGESLARAGEVQLVEQATQRAAESVLPTWFDFLARRLKAAAPVVAVKEIGHGQHRNKRAGKDNKRDARASRQGQQDAGFIAEVLENGDETLKFVFSIALEIFLGFLFCFCSAFLIALFDEAWLQWWLITPMILLMRLFLPSFTLAGAHAILRQLGSLVFEVLFDACAVFSCTGIMSPFLPNKWQIQACYWLWWRLFAPTCTIKRFKNVLNSLFSRPVRLVVGVFRFLEKSLIQMAHILSKTIAGIIYYTRWLLSLLKILILAASMGIVLSLMASMAMSFWTAYGDSLFRHYFYQQCAWSYRPPA